MYKGIRWQVGKIYLFVIRMIYIIFRKHLDVFSAENVILSAKKSICLKSAHSTLESVYLSIKQNKSGLYLRFGDGDVFLMMNQSDLLQESNPQLCEDMEDAFLISGDGVFKCLAIHSDLFGYDDGMYIGNHKVSDEYAIRLLMKSYKYFISQPIYSPVALHFVATKDPIIANNFLKEIKRKTKIFVGNENIENDIKELLFGDSVHIKTPSINAYTKIDEIEKTLNLEIENNNGDFVVVCIAMGCSGRILMSRVWKYSPNVFIFDFGSLLDGIAGNKTRTWLEVNDIDYDTLLNNL